MTTFAEREAEFFGVSNTESLQRVPLGREAVAFVSPSQILIYEEYPRLGMVLNLTPTMRKNLLKALGATEIESAVQS